MSPDRGRQLWLVPVLLSTVIATAIGGLTARGLYAQPDEDTPEAVLPTGTTVPPGEQPGSPVVGGTLDATEHPLFEPARAVLQTYFDAINARDYRAWATAVTEERLAQQSEAEWRASYESTRDGSIVLYRIELTDEDTARVLMRFTSTQDPEHAPPELQEPCIVWNVVFPLVEHDSGWRIDAGTTTSIPRHEACP